MSKLNEAFEVHSKLNQKLWDSENKLKPEVKDKILEIVAAFEDYLDAPIQICDVQLVGSNASYNYTDDSDLDVHIIADYDIITDNTEILKVLYDTKKSKFNSKFDISVHGVPIEMGVQDVNSGITSNGIYSVLDDDWVKEPKPITKFIQHNIEDELNKWKNKIDKLIAKGDADELRNARSMLHLVRRNSIAVDGEYGAGNQLFKELRAAGYTQKLKDAATEAQSKKLSLESIKESYYCKGSFISRFDDKI